MIINKINDEEATPPQTSSGILRKAIYCSRRGGRLMARAALLYAFRNTGFFLQL